MSAGQYEQLVYESDQACLAIIAGGEPEAVAHTMLAAALKSANPAFVKTLAIALTLVENATVRRAAVVALCHLVRRYELVDLSDVVRVVERLRSDPRMRGAVADLEGDMQVFASERDSGT